MKEEKIIKPISGYPIALIAFLLIAGSALMIVNTSLPYFIALIIIGVLLVPGFIILNPNESSVLTLFGDYKGTVKKSGFSWVNPFYMKKKISLRARNIDSEPIKVNDKLGNPIMIGSVLVWRVEDTYKAAFDVDAYERFVYIQSEAAIRKLAGAYPYDTFDDEEAEISLRDGGEEVNDLLEKEMDERLAIAGIEVIEARISHLAYASEIASAMLQRQQATAIIAARIKIVEGAVSMVDMALEELSRKNIVELDDDKKAAMVSNLMVVLCSDKGTSPVINAGTLYQ